MLKGRGLVICEVGGVRGEWIVVIKVKLSGWISCCW